MAEVDIRLTAAQGFHKRLVKILSEQLGVTEPMVLLERTMDDLGGDSLDGVEIMMAVEEEFDIQITDCEMDKLRTTRDLVSLVLPKLLAHCTFDDAHNIAARLTDEKPAKKQAPKKPPAKAVMHAPEKSRKRHLDDVFEYTLSDSAMSEFVKSFNTIFSDSKTAYLYASKTPHDSNAWRIQMMTRLSGEAVDEIARYIEDAGFAFVKSTEHMGQLPGSENYGIVTVIHLSLITYGL